MGSARKLIVDTLSEAGLIHDHVAIILNDGTGDNPVNCHWCRDADGQYTVHGNPDVA